MNIVIIGAGGHMGQALIKLLTAQGHTLAGAVDTKLAKPDALKSNTLELDCPVSDRLTPDMTTSDVIIDFSAPAATANVVQTLSSIKAASKVAYVVGTTGLTDETQQTLTALSRTMAIVQAANTSVGVTIMSAVVAQVAQHLGDEFDIDICEMHHNRKVDSPSGTALALGDAIARATGAPNTGSTERTGRRPKGAIGYAVLRGGTVAGEHTVVFAGPQERLEITHRAQDRVIFAHGSLRAALWVAGKPAGLYDMTDVLDLPKI